MEPLCSRRSGGLPASPIDKARVETRIERVYDLGWVATRFSTADDVSVDLVGAGA
jgi:hypothetical protein